MQINYNVEITQFGNTIIWYEQNGFRVCFTIDEANPDYQAYLAALGLTTDDLKALGLGGNE